MSTAYLSLGLVVGPMEIILVIAVIVLIFGARKIPMLARGLGAGIRNFKGEIGKPAEPSDEEDDLAG